jgi:hypothetical protein
MRLPCEDQRILVLDTTKEPPQVLTNCLVCNRLTGELESEGIACPECYGKWSRNYAKKFVLPY